ncbi:type II toxin-antitoxin system PemK/MazF family toxin [Enterobacter hormaechei]|uniref:type II toxin-antitoxin system PemK/MazF family toxin n=1 Tax=Enterobacter hormaechei TaxID=158836 RepID=UPI0018C28BDB|nr:type II toxin-antitoxin system PemK/MazF family toxin [Enterobacter hormaechei]MBG0656734.1 type II toxin-antitoxin system PemK/MazF family toxin [Enterobacter hormaechei]MCM7612018.1 type II toxin-antitoxin system PemK/MazF family toxin [Enterobacter hormaechei]
MPDHMTIKYWLESDGTLLGTETYESITEVTLPIPSEGGHPITLTRFFSGHESHRWLVERVEHSTLGQADLYLTPRAECKNEVFLAKTYSSKRTIASRITKGTLVEVEYGFIQSTKRLTGKISSIKRYPDLVQHGEMHKRRLAIVVSSRLPSLQVIPVTSVHPNTGDKAIFELSPDSLSNLVNYNNPTKRSFGLGNMIQTVSLRRVLPPMTLQEGRCYRDVGYTHRLNRADMKALETAITTAVGYNDYQSIRDERNQLRLEVRQLQESRTQMAEELATHRDNQIENERLSLRCHALEERMIDWYRSMNGSLSLEGARVQMEEELNLYLETFSD